MLMRIILFLAVVLVRRAHKGRGEANARPVWASTTELKTFRYTIFCVAFGTQKRKLFGGIQRSSFWLAFDRMVFVHQNNNDEHNPNGVYKLGVWLQSRLNVSKSQYFINIVRMTLFCSDMES